MAWYNLLDNAEKYIVDKVKNSILGDIDQSLSEDEKELLTDIALTIAYGAIPVVGQIIDAALSVDAAIDLYKNPNSNDNKFNFVVALMGWLPILGDGTKASLKTVNKNPEVYAPIMFSTIRYAFNKAADNSYVQDMARSRGWDIKQIKYLDPEALLIRYTSSDFVQGQFNIARGQIKGSDAYKALPPNMRVMVDSVFSTAASNLPQWIGLVGDRVGSWRRKPSRSTHHDGDIHSRKTSEHEPSAPYNKHGQKSGQGASNPAKSKNRVKNATIKMTKAITGVVGEHMADYYMDKKHNTGGLHDQGMPSNNKVSQNKELKKLLSAPTGVGIDGLWKDVNEINTITNDKKGFCIVEAKASVSFANKKLPQLLTVKRGDPTAPNGRLVQMSYKWCESNAYKIGSRVGDAVTRRGYSRRVFYYNQLSISEHELALGQALAGKSGREVEQTHSHASSRNHEPTDIFRDKEIEAAVKQRQNPRASVNKTIKEADIPK
jgi:hypothetical protein